MPFLLSIPKSTGLVVDKVYSGLINGRSQKSKRIIEFVFFVAYIGIALIFPYYFQIQSILKWIIPSLMIVASIFSYDLSIGISGSSENGWNITRYYGYSLFFFSIHLIKLTNVEVDFLVLSNRRRGVSSAIIKGFQFEEKLLIDNPSVKKSREELENIGIKCSLKSYLKMKRESRLEERVE